MSLFIEQHDLESVAWELSREPFVDEKNVFLCGSSRGATVAASFSTRRLTYTMQCARRVQTATIFLISFPS